MQAAKKAAEAAARKVQEDLEGVLARHEADVADWEASMAEDSHQMSERHRQLEVSSTGHHLQTLILY